MKVKTKMKTLNQANQTIQQRLNNGAKDAQAQTTSLNALQASTLNGQQALQTEVGHLNKQGMNLQGFGTTTPKNSQYLKLSGLTLGQGGNLTSQKQALEAKQEITGSLTNSAMQCVAHYNSIKHYPSKIVHYLILNEDAQSLKNAAQSLKLILWPLKNESDENINKFILELTGFLATSKFALSHNEDIQTVQINRWTKDLADFPLWAIYKGFDIFGTRYESSQPTPGQIKNLIQPLVQDFHNEYWTLVQVLQLQKTFNSKKEIEKYESELKAEKRRKQVEETQAILQKQEDVLQKLTQKEQQRLEKQNNELKAKQTEREKQNKRLANIQKIIDEQARFNGLVKEADALIQKIQQASEVAGNLTALESKLLNS